MDSGNNVVAAVNISTVLVRHSRESVQNNLAPEVLETAQLISRLLRGDAVGA